MPHQYHVISAGTGKSHVIEEITGQITRWMSPHEWTTGLMESPRSFRCPDFDEVYANAFIGDRIVLFMGVLGTSLHSLTVIPTPPASCPRYFSTIDDSGHHIPRSEEY